MDMDNWIFLQTYIEYSEETCIVDTNIVKYKHALRHKLIYLNISMYCTHRYS